MQYVVIKQKNIYTDKIPSNEKALCFIIIQINSVKNNSK